MAQADKDALDALLGSAETKGETVGRLFGALADNLLVPFAIDIPSFTPAPRTGRTR